MLHVPFTEFWNDISLISMRENAFDSMTCFMISFQFLVADLAQGAFGKEESTETTNQWAGAMFPLADELIMLQTNLLYDIASHELVNNTKGAAVRVLDLLIDWKRWIDANLEKAHLANMKATRDTLDWRGEVPVWNSDGHGSTTFLAKKTSCTVRGINACETMRCRNWDARHEYTPKDSFNPDLVREVSRYACDYQDAHNFYWQYLSPKVAKLQSDVESMIVALGDVAGFEKMGHGYCPDYMGGTASDAISLEHCANQCWTDSSCKYFAFKLNTHCSRYPNTTDCNDPWDGQLADLVTYRRPPSSPYHNLGAGRHTQGYFFTSGQPWELLKTNQTHQSKGPGTPEYKGWVEAAWKKCLEKDAATTHVSVWHEAWFRCYRTTTDTITTIDGSNVHTWRKEKAAEVAPFAMKKEGAGNCGPLHFFTTGRYVLSPQALGQQYLESTTYMAWVAAAWAQCAAKSPNTTYVSVWIDASFQCYDSNTCTLDHNVHESTATWRPWWRK